MEKNGYFKSKKISDSVTRIYGITGELMYLVEGADKAALIDTGTGIGNLKAFVETITDKPIFVILTHGHMDHFMGSYGFDEIYMNPNDKDTYNQHCEPQMREDYAKSILGKEYEKIDKEDFTKPISCESFKDIFPGDIFNLGGVTLEICIGEGHTRGSITVLIVEERSLILGDACNNFTFVWDENSLGITSYKKSMMELENMVNGRYDKVYLSHGDGDGPKEMLSSAIMLCDDIIAGNTDDVPFSFLGYNAVVAKKWGLKHERLDGGIANIVYDKDRVDE